MGKEVVAIFERRFARHYQPEMAAAAIVDPAFFDVTDGDISLPLHLLTSTQIKDVVAVIARLNGGDVEEAVEAELQSMELPSSWELFRIRVEAIKLCEKQADGTSKLASASDRRKFWAAPGVVQTWPLFAKAAQRLLSVHVTSAAAERNWSVWGQVYHPLRNAMGVETASKIIFCRGKMMAAAQPVADGKEIQLS